MRRSVWLCMAAVLLLTGCGSTQKNDVHAYTADVFAMDTYMNLKVYSTDDSALQAAQARIEELEALFSVTEADSDIGRINASAGEPVQVNGDTLDVLDTALTVWEQTGGALDVTVYPVLREWGFTTQDYKVPDDDTLAQLLGQVDAAQIAVSGDTVMIPADAMLDLGALAKGYTSDSVIGMFRESGAESALVNLGGNVQALGRKPDDSLWRVGVLDPFSPTENMCVLEIEDCAVITSGNYERYFIADDGNRYWHIIDPADGYPADNGLVSVTIVGQQGVLCDALSTALFVLGTERAVEYWQTYGGFEMLLVTDDGRILVSDGLQPEFLTDMPVEVVHHG